MAINQGTIIDANPVIVDGRVVYVPDAANGRPTTTEPPSYSGSGSEEPFFFDQVLSYHEAQDGRKPLVVTLARFALNLARSLSHKIATPARVVGKAFPSTRGAVGQAARQIAGSVRSDARERWRAGAERFRRSEVRRAAGDIGWLVGQRANIRPALGALAHGLNEFSGRFHDRAADKVKPYLDRARQTATEVAQEARIIGGAGRTALRAFMPDYNARKSAQSNAPAANAPAQRAVSHSSAAPALATRS